MICARRLLLGLWAWCSHKKQQNPLSSAGGRVLGSATSETPLKAEVAPAVAPAVAMAPRKKPAAAMYLACGWKGCTHAINVKNSQYRLQRKQVSIKDCRQLRAHCKTIHFCSPEHMTLCKKQPSQRKEGSPEGCEALDIPQVVCLFQTLCAIAYPWAAALMMVQLFLGERADAARSVECAWLKNVISESDLEEGEAEAPILDLPEICLPGNINKKTGERTVALDRAFSDLLRGWLQRKPLLGARDTQWPWKGQDVKGAHKEHAVLFPGKDTHSQERLWQVPVSERAYHHAIRKAVQEIARARVEAEKLGKTHVFTDVDLSRVSTHAIKKTCVSLLSESGTSMSVIAAITNTSVPVLKRHYDVPTNSRKRRAVTAAFGRDVVQGIAGEMSDSPSACTSPVRAVSNETDDVSQPQLDMYCPWCGRGVSRLWRYCCQCGRPLPEHHRSN